MSFVLSPVAGATVCLGVKMGLVLLGAFVVLLTLVGLVLLDRVHIEPFAGWDSPSDF